MLIATAKWIHLLALATWLGAVVLLSFVVAPGIFGAFPDDQRAEAGRVMAAIFPGYYRVGMVCGGLMLVTALTLWARAGSAGWHWAVEAGLVATMWAASAYAGAVIQPRAGELRVSMQQAGAAPETSAEFAVLHRRAVQLNVIVLVGALLSSGIVAAKLRP